MRHNAGSSSPNDNPGGKAGCRKEQYDANVLFCGHYKRRDLLEDCLYLCREGGFQERSKDLGKRNKKLVAGVLSRR